MWTINDFPAYSMLFGWSTSRRLTCPYCMNNSKIFWLYSGGKFSWFDCHCQFLPMDHAYPRNKNAFFKNRIEKSWPPLMLSRDDVWEQVAYFPKITEKVEFTCDGCGVTHNWIKQSIFWELLYWNTNLLRHNLDVMHIEKNVWPSS